MIGKKIGVARLRLRLLATCTLIALGEWAVGGYQIVIDQLSLVVLIFSLHNDFLTYLFLGVHFNKWANICFSSVTQN